MKCTLNIKPVKVIIEREHWEIRADIMQPCPDADCDCGITTQHADRVRLTYLDLRMDPERFNRIRRSMCIYLKTPDDEGLPFSDMHELVEKCDDYVHLNPEEFPGMFPLGYW